MDEIEAGVHVHCPKCGDEARLDAAVARNGLCNCHHGQEYHSQVGCLIVGCGCPSQFSHLIAAPPPV